MRWPPWRKAEPMTKPEPPPIGATDLDEARCARASSEAALRQTQNTDPSIRATAARLRELRITNGFAADIGAAMRHRKA